MTKYNDLSDAGKQQARDKMRDDPDFYWLVGPDESDLNEEFEFICREDYGMEDLKFTYSLGHCQGDGVAFSGTPDLEKMAEKDPWLKAQIDAFDAWYVMIEHEMSDTDYQLTIKHEGRYSHWNSMNVEFEILFGHDYGTGQYTDTLPKDSYPSRVEKDIREHLEEKIKQISRRLEKDGYALIESYQTDEYLDDYLSGNECEEEEEEEEEIEV